MIRSRDRDESMERLLRQSTDAPQDSGITDACLDAEALAAMIDGGLSGPALDAAQSMWPLRPLPEPRWRSGARGFIYASRGAPPAGSMVACVGGAGCGGCGRGRIMGGCASSSRHAVAAGS